MPKIALICIAIGVLALPSCQAEEPPPPPPPRKAQTDVPLVQDFAEMVKGTLRITDVEVTEIECAADNSLCKASFRCKNLLGWTVFEGGYVWAAAEGADKPAVIFVQHKPFFVGYKDVIGPVDPFDTDEDDKSKTEPWMAALVRVRDALAKAEEEKKRAGKK